MSNKNSHEFVHEYKKKPEYVELMRRLSALDDGKEDQSKFILSLIFHHFIVSITIIHLATHFYF